MAEKETTPLDITTQLKVNRISDYNLLCWANYSYNYLASHNTHSIKYYTDVCDLHWYNQRFGITALAI